MRLNKEDLLLYAVTDRRWLKEGETLVTRTEEAIDGGVTFVQLREKDLDEETFEREGRELKELCRKRGVPFVINDNVKLAAKLDADGVHVGQSDMEALDVRRIIGGDKILGVSVKTVDNQLAIAVKKIAEELNIDLSDPLKSKIFLSFLLTF